VGRVPFTLRSGKALAADSAEIAIHFRPLPRYLPDQWPGVEPDDVNALQIKLWPQVSGLFCCRLA
jgi:glucose-6-phosphate 1-dehydrogenase